MVLHRSESSPLSHQVRLERLSISLIFLISHSKSDMKINLDCRFKRERERQRNRCMKRRSIEDFIHRSSSPEQVEDYLSRVEQLPSKSMQTALSPSRKALVADDKEMIPSPKPVLNLAKKVEEDAPKTSSKRKRTPVEEKVEDETPNTSSKKKRTPAKKKASDTVVYGHNLVDSKVKVWWQDDEKFYEGVIVSYDPVNKKHKVSYTDCDKEVLNLRQEKWEFVGDDSMSDAEQAAECRSPDPSHEMYVLFPLICAPTICKIPEQRIYDVR